MYLIYNVATSRIWTERSFSKSYKTIGSAKAKLTRLIKSGKVTTGEYAISEVNEYYEKIEQQVTVRNLMSGQPVKQSINTPLCCDVSSETYWSM